MGPKWLPWGDSTGDHYPDSDPEYERNKAQELAQHARSDNWGDKMKDQDDSDENEGRHYGHLW